MSMNMNAIAMVATLGVFCALAASQTPGSSAATTAPKAEVNPLAGPSVDEAGTEGAASQVRRDFEGRVKRLEVRPEEAALGSLSLSDAERDATGAVLAKRAALMDGLVRDNLNLLLRVRTAREGGDAQELRAVLRELTEAFAPLAAEGTLEEQLSGALSPANAQELRRLTASYWSAVAHDSMSMAGEMGDASSKVISRDAMMRVTLEALGQEIKRSYDRVIGEGASKIEQLTAELQLTPEQQAKIRELTISFVQETNRQPTRWQRTKLFLQIRQELNAEQRERFMELIREQRGE